jgi:hypothetical protein
LSEVKDYVNSIPAIDRIDSKMFLENKNQLKMSINLWNYWKENSSLTSKGYFRPGRLLDFNTIRPGHIIYSTALGAFLIENINTKDRTVNISRGGKAFTLNTNESIKLSYNATKGLILNA